MKSYSPRHQIFFPWSFLFCPGPATAAALQGAPPRSKAQGNPRGYKDVILPPQGQGLQADSTGIEVADLGAQAHDGQNLQVQAAADIEGKGAVGGAAAGEKLAIKAAVAQAGRNIGGEGKRGSEANPQSGSNEQGRVTAG